MKVGVYQAKTHLPQLLDEVAAGEEVVITRHGKAVARLVPAAVDEGMEAREAIVALREFNRGRRAGMSVREMIEEGRR